MLDAVLQISDCLYELVTNEDDVDDAIDAFTASHAGETWLAVFYPEANERLVVQLQRST